MAIRVLISGAGIAGPAAAWFLRRSKSPMAITVVERASSLRTSGQNIDIRGPAIDVIQKMRVEPAIRDKNTTEEGIFILDINGKVQADFPMEPGSSSFTSEYEILRGDLAEILNNASLNDDKDVNKQTTLDYVYGDSIASITQQEMSSENDEVQVGFKSGKSASYDMVILADGVFSSPRQLVFGKEVRPGQNNSISDQERPLRDPIKSMKQYWGLFTMPQIPGVTDQDRYARWCNITRGRLLFTRPDPYGTLRVLLAVTREDLHEYDEVMAGRNTEELKKLFKREFEDAGWISKELIEGMEKSDSFYCQLTAQVKMDEIVKGRVALLGDAGYCPSPLSGQGTSIAFIGADILGQCLADVDSAGDVPSALKEYERRVKPEAEKAQKLFPGAPWIANPQTQVGINVLNSCLWMISSFSSAKKTIGKYFTGSSSSEPASATAKA